MNSQRSRKPEVNPPTGLVWFCLLITCVYCGYFFIQQLPNNPTVNRLDVWGRILDGVLLSSPAPLNFQLQSVSPAEAVLQRGPIITQSLVLLLLSWSLGSFAVRALNLSQQFMWSEKLAIQCGLGMSFLSLWTLFAGTCGSMQSSIIAAPSIFSAIGLLLLRKRIRSAGSTPTVLHEQQTYGIQNRSIRICFGILLTAMVCYLGYLFAGAMSPPSDFDVREYHLQGPKEWFQAGNIHFLKHNVYTSFPFLTEMLSLAGMIFTGDWWTGALAGKVILAAYAPLTALCVFSISYRIAGLLPAMLAAIVHLTAPWTFRISIIAYAEGGLTFYLAATFMCLLIIGRNKNCTDDQHHLVIVAGMLAGSAMACKYTGLISVVIPGAALLVLRLHTSFRPAETPESACGAKPILQTLRLLCLFAVGTAFTVGPWLFRNVVETGNPVYPLAYSVFGGDEWSPEIDARWKVAHGPPEHSISRIPQHILDVTLRNDWTSPLLFALVLPSLLLAFRQSVNGQHDLLLTGLLSAWQFTTWWALTHRIDRFWIPAIPLLAIAAGCTWNWSSSRLWRRSLLLVILTCTAFNLRFCSEPIIGFNAGMSDLRSARELPIRADLRELNATLPSEAIVLMVGEAEVFDATFRVVYNTVFDDSIFEEWTANSDDAGLQTAEQIRGNLADHGVTHILVNWFEVLRYRMPGSYGYSEYVQPSRLEALVAMGVVTSPQVLLARPMDSFSSQELDILAQWDGIETLMTHPDQIAGVLLYRVED